MIPLSRERRQGERRADARGGRRATDRAGSCVTAQSCPSCGGIASEVGEADGGWWFVCEGCDHFWNERERLVSDRPGAHADAHRPANLLVKLKNVFRGVTRAETPGRSNPTT